MAAFVPPVRCHLRAGNSPNPCVAGYHSSKLLAAESFFSPVATIFSEPF